MQLNYIRQTEIFDFSTETAYRFFFLSAFLRKSHSNQIIFWSTRKKKSRINRGRRNNAARLIQNCSRVDFHSSTSKITKRAHETFSVSITIFTYHSHSMFFFGTKCLLHFFHFPSYGWCNSSMIMRWACLRWGKKCSDVDYWGQTWEYGTDIEPPSILKCVDRQLSDDIFKVLPECDALLEIFFLHFYISSGREFRDFVVIISDIPKLSAACNLENI